MSTAQAEWLQQLRRQPVELGGFAKCSEGEQAHFVSVCRNAFDSMVLTHCDDKTRYITRQNRFKIAAQMAADQAKTIGVFQRRASFGWEALLIQIALMLFRMWWDNRE